MIVRSSRVRPSKSPPKRPGPRAGAQELVQQIAVAGLDIDELKADVAGQSGRGDVAVDQPLQVVVGPDDRVHRPDRCRTSRRAADDDRRSAARAACCCGREKRPECVSCRPTSRSSVRAERLPMRRRAARAAAPPGRRGSPAWPASDWDWPGHRAARRPLRRPRSASRRSGRSSASGAASAATGSHRDWRPSLPSDECTSDCRP